MIFFRCCLFLLCIPLVTFCQTPKLYFTPYICTEGNFKVDYPGVPDYRMEPIELANIELENHYFDLRDFMADTLFFTLRYTDYVSSQLNSSMKNKLIMAFFEDSRNLFLKNMDGEELSYEIINFEEYPGYEIKVGVGDKKSVVTKRLLLVKNRVYVLKAFTSKNDPKPHLVQAFLDSFELLSSIADEEPYNYLLDHNVPKPVFVDTIITLDPYTLREDLVVIDHYTNWADSIIFGKEIFNTDKGQKIVDYYIDRGEKKVKSISRSAVANVNGQ